MTAGPRQRVVRVLLADNEVLARAGCRMAIEADECLTVVGEAGDGESALALALDEKPDVVVARSRPSGLDGVGLTRRAREDGRLTGAAVIVFGPVEEVFEALRAGAMGFLLGDTDGAELRHAVRTVARGEAFLAAGVTGRVVSEVASRTGPSPAWRQRLAALTVREREVVAAVGRGLPNEGIARRLHMSPATARTHVSRALNKLGVRDRSHLVVLAYESGLVAPGALAPERHPIYADARPAPSR